MKHYRGWDIWMDPNGPVTGRWRARKFGGVTMGHNTEDGLKRMIDQKVEDARQEKKS